MSAELESVTPREATSTRHLAFGILTLASLSISLFILRPLLPIIAWALALSVTTHPWYRWVLRRTRHETPSALLSLTLTTLVLVCPLVWVGHILLATGLEGLKIVADRASRPAPFDMTELPEPLRDVVVWLETYARLGSIIAQAHSFITEAIPKLLTSTVLGGMELLLILFTTFFFVRDGSRFIAGLSPLLPLSEEELSLLVSRAADTLHATIFGIVAVGILHGALGAFIFWYLNLPHPTLWGLVMGVLALVPYLGTFIVWIPAATLLALSGEWRSATTLVLWGTCVIAMSDNILYPALVGRRMHFHTLAIFLFLLGGMFVMGSAGVILGPISLATSYTLLEIWRARLARNGLPQNTTR